MRPSDAGSASSALLWAARMANPSACIDKREPARLPARGASKQASIAYASPRELLGESDRSVAGLRDFAKTPGPRAAPKAPKAPAPAAAHTGTSPVRHRRDDVAATAWSDHDHPRRATSEAQQETAN